MREEAGDEDHEHVLLKVLVVKGTKGPTILAYAVLQKGGDEDGYAVARVVEDVKMFGYTHPILKTDGVRGLMRGWVPTLLRDVPYNMVQFGVYHNVCAAVRNYTKADSRGEMSLWQNFLVGGVAGPASSSHAKNVSRAGTNHTP